MPSCICCGQVANGAIYRKSIQTTTACTITIINGAGMGPGRWSIALCGNEFDKKPDDRPSLVWRLSTERSVKTTEVGGEHGFDGAKKVNGRKRHILVDTMGNLLKVLSHAANIGERAGAQQLLLQVPQRLWERLEKILADGGYEGRDFQGWVEQTVDVELEIALRPTNAKGFVLVPIRWVVERTFAWLGRYRRLSKDYERLTENSESMLYLASISRLLNRLVPA